MWAENLKIVLLKIILFLVPVDDLKLWEICRVAITARPTAALVVVAAHRDVYTRVAKPKGVLLLGVAVPICTGVILRVEVAATRDDAADAAAPGPPAR